MPFDYDLFLQFFLRVVIDSDDYLFGCSAVAGTDHDLIKMFKDALLREQFGLVYAHGDQLLMRFDCEFMLDRIGGVTFLHTVDLPYVVEAQDLEKYLSGDGLADGITILIVDYLLTVPKLPRPTHIPLCS